MISCFLSLPTSSKPSFSAISTSSVIVLVFTSLKFISCIENSSEKIKIDEKRKELREEIKLEKERAKDIKIFLRKEQAIIRKEQAEKQRKFLEELKLEKLICKKKLKLLKNVLKNLNF